MGDRVPLVNELLETNPQLLLRVLCTCDAAEDVIDSPVLEITLQVARSWGRHPGQESIGIKSSGHAGAPEPAITSNEVAEVLRPASTLPTSPRNRLEGRP